MAQSGRQSFINSRFKKEEFGRFMWIQIESIAG